MNPSPEVSLHRKFPRRTPRAALGFETYGAELWRQAALDSLRKFDPRTQIRNPVMFVVWLGALVTASLTIQPDLFGPTDASRTYNGVVTIILLLTVWFANFAEAMAEGRGKAKAVSLRRTKTELTARRVQSSGEIEQVPAANLLKEDVVRVDKGELIPTDGEVIEGIAYVDESAITGESAPVMKEPNTDMFSSVTAGTILISDFLLVRTTANPGESFLDRMIHLVEGAKRQKTPNEMALTVLLAILTLIFVIVVATMAPVAVYLQAQNQRRRSDRAPGRSDSNHHRRAAVRDRHRRHRSHVPIQCARDVRQGRGGGRRRANTPARQDRHDHHGQPAGDRVHSA